MLLYRLLHLDDENAAEALKQASPEELDQVDAQAMRLRGLIYAEDNRRKMIPHAIENKEEFL